MEPFAIHLRLGDVDMFGHPFRDGVMVGYRPYPFQFPVVTPAQLPGFGAHQAAEYFRGMGGM
jgi:hypothetical protein